jgi:CHRD domain
MTRPIRSATTLAALAIGLAMATNDPQAAGQMEDLTFTAALSPANEVPAIANAESKGGGEVTIVLHLTRDASKAITAATADFKGSLKGFPAETAITAAHIHRGATGTNGAVAVNPMFKAGEITLSGGGGSFSKMGVTVTPAVAQEIVSGPATFYFNVHSAMNTGGVARGQLMAGK